MPSITVTCDPAHLSNLIFLAKRSLAALDGQEFDSAAGSISAMRNALVQAMTPAPAVAAPFPVGSATP